MNENKIIIYAHEQEDIKETFSKETLELWKPYLDLLRYDDWYFQRMGLKGNDKNEWMLKTPFSNVSMFDSKNDMSLPETKKWIRDCAIHKYGTYHNAICRPDSDIDAIGCASTHVEKWTREKYLLRYLQTFNIERFSDEEIWSLINWIWGNNDFNCGSETTRDAWKEIFQIRPRPESLTSHLPEKFTVYRGGHPEGYAWTSSRKTAEDFHNRNALWSGDDDNFLCKRVVTRDEVAFTDGSSLDEDFCENEIVLFPRDDFVFSVLEEEPRRSRNGTN